MSGMQGGPVVILGMMASGKSTVGSRLARRLGRRLLDSDEQIEAETGRKVRQIEASKGLSAVHVLEAAMLEAGVRAPRPAVVAAASSVVDHPLTVERLKPAFVVWLRIRPETMLARMSGDPDNRHRPSLGAGSDAEMLEQIRQIDQRRAPYFESNADLVLDVDSLDPDDAVEAVLAVCDLPELVLDAGAIVGEGPVWDPQSSVLWWVDITGRRIHRFEPATGRDDIWDTPREPTALALRHAGGLVVTTPQGIEAFHPDRAPKDRLELLIPIEADRSANRANDAKCDRRGRFWVGTLAYDFAPDQGRVYRVEPSGDVTTVIEKATLSNGLGWTEDDATFYFADSVAGQVAAYDFDLETGTLGHRRVVVPTDGRPFNPDGLTIDQEGCLWVAHFADGPGSVCGVPGGITRFAPDGQELTSIRMPVSYVTSACFGGADLRDLYITTGRIDVPQADLVHEPHAGGLFRWRAKVAGSVLHGFGG
jgi:L-arabinonolactonase